MGKLSDSSALETADHAVPLTSLRGVGPRILERLTRLGIDKVPDLLWHLPMRYEDRSRILSPLELCHGMEGMVLGEIVRVQRGQGARRALVVWLDCGIRLRFFHFHHGLSARFEGGGVLQCFGQIRSGNQGLEMVHPDLTWLSDSRHPILEDHLTPVYPSVAGLHQKLLRRLVGDALDQLEDDDSSIVTDPLFDDCHWPGLFRSLMTLHRPGSGVAPDELLDPDHPARLRLAAEELVAHQLECRRVREVTSGWQAPEIATGGVLLARFLEGLPFGLTGAQERAIDEISQDMSSSPPMQRLLQGDVGTGKTVVAAATVIQAVASGHQAAVMAPTELLVEQHFASFSRWFDPQGILVGLVTGQMSVSDRRDTMARLRGGEIQVVIGTHALFQEGVSFASLGLIIIDEQHRFGVEQRLSLVRKGRSNGMSPHLLIMTATPIPRTLMMTAYADLSCSVIDELPPGRTPVETVVISDVRRNEVLQRVAHACAAGRQVYWVCTLIEASEATQCQAAEDTARSLSENLLGIRVGLVHGRMAAEEKHGVMMQFRDQALDLLVATTVIEVGVDVPNASVMIIDNAERLGLSQLHQLRGRVGRGSMGGVCLLMYHPPLSRQGSERLDAMRATNDGFEIARRDLALRGPGEVLGTRQAGYARFKVADLVRHQHLLEYVGESVTRVERHFRFMVPVLSDRWLGNAARFKEVG